MSTKARLFLSVIIPNAVGLLSSYAVSSSLIQWYPSLKKPWFTPPGWLFAPVWVTLYTLMGLALFLVWREGWKKPAVARALVAFDIQLVLNGAWSILFFGMHTISGALIEIVFLWLSILITAFLFWKVKRTAAILLIPYVLWVSCAIILNWSILTLNT